ncbi:4Fe-4S dicluster domain-containing protein [Eggerthella sinensis]|uniref:Molybdopterin oxidoreductase n=1 Tax=Eggerthella sinensis TaxID=242230 RepID=A0A3N0IVC4_9ACTN|nr:4Fe-4S dicluster domain-containing protein [Eggerthella sinensis]RDB65465.1 molybdopterin oxidoreductase [Eggerthella sinensis]RNM40847.1 molybdopterin oxidoreductase [Eggerthella sinensis]
MTKYGMAIDLTRCTGCQTCVVTCQMNNNQRPGVSWSAVDTIEEGTWPDGDRFQLPHACMHCDDAPCVHACPTGASAQRDDGIVTVDYDTCLACGACVMVCPYEARHISFKDAWYFGADEPAPYESYGTPHTDVAEKCIFCAERVDDGALPHCVEACPMAARLFGDVSDPSSEISAYIEANNAENLRGTSLYYVKGDHDFSLREALMTNESNVPAIVRSEAAPAGPAGETQGPNAAVIGVGAVAVAAVAAGAGFAAGASRGKKHAHDVVEGKEGE